jgi:hypothetical protein
MFEQEEAMARAHTFQVDSGSVLATWLVHFSKQSTCTINQLSKNNSLRKHNVPYIHTYSIYPYNKHGTLLDLLQSE